MNTIHQHIDNQVNKACQPHQDKMLVYLQLADMPERNEGEVIIDDAELRKHWQSAMNAVYEMAFDDEVTPAKYGFVWHAGERDSSDGVGYDGYWTWEVDE